MVLSVVLGSSSGRALTVILIEEVCACLGKAEALGDERMAQLLLLHRGAFKETLEVRKVLTHLNRPI